MRCLIALLVLSVAAPVYARATKELAPPPTNLTSGPVRMFPSHNKVIQRCDHWFIARAKTSYAACGSNAYLCV